MTLGTSMSGARRLAALGLGCALLLALVVPTGAAAANGPRGVGQSGVAWAPCFQDIAAQFAEFLPPELAPTYECALVGVPLDYDEPRGGTVGISLVRLPATDPGARQGSVFLNPGGPGGSGVEFAVFGAPFLYSPNLRAEFDLVGFDPRGIVRSTALKCFGNIEQAISIFDAPVVAFPKNAAEAELWFADEQDRADACSQRGNKVLGHMSTANVARDLDLLREAVGDEQLTYAGYSYGSYLGVTYANLFPDRVRAVIVDGVLNPIDWSTGDPGEEDVPFSSRLRSNVGAQDTLEEFFRLCDEAGPALCAFAPDAAARYEALAAELLDDEPVQIVVPVGPDEFAEVPFFYGDLIGFSLGAMYDSSSWFFFAQDLAFIEASVLGTAGAPPPGFAVGGDGDQAYTARRGFPRYVNFVENFPAVACADSDNPDTIGDWVAAAGDISFDDYFRQLWTYASSPCLAFPAADDDRYTGPYDAGTSNPVLVASTLYDPATPVHGALEVDALLPDTGLLLVDGWGHTTLGLSGCASFFSERYLLTTQLPPAGLVCPQDFNPFELFGDGPPPEGMQRTLEARARFVGGR